jgi:hypothetical protein
MVICAVLCGVGAAVAALTIGSAQKPRDAS